jgi:hypothetical protein
MRRYVRKYHAGTGSRPARARGTGVRRRGMRHSRTVTTDAVILRDAVAGYAQRLHAAAGSGHHVASPLGAWLLLALCGPAIRDGAAPRSALDEVLGCDAGQAARLAGDLLARPHPQVAAAAAAWTRDQREPPAAVRGWQAGLPPAVASGPVPDQAGADAWARDHTFGLIERFPARISPRTGLVLATALASRVSWEQPFDLAPAAELGAQSPWSRLGQVLATPARPGRSGHRALLAVTPEAGDVLVHLAQAQGGLLVASVAAAAGVPYTDVLAAAQRIGSAAVTGAAIPPRALADLPLGEGPRWRITEEPASGPGGTADRFTAVLPAWSARTELDLAGPELGFGPVAAALAGGDPWTAVQSAMARYSRTGFEAAAVTAIAIAASARRPPAGRRRAAQLRFGSPYAVVAVAVDAGDGGPPGLWHGVPVFSAWVADPQDAADPEPGSGSR